MDHIDIELENALINFKRAIIETMRDQTKKIDCTMAQWEILHIVSEKKNPTMKEIASLLQITPPSVTAIITPMIKKGLVKRQYDPADRRTVHITLTPKSSLIVKNLTNKKHSLFKKMFSKITISEKEYFITVLKKITAK
ncbi:MAG: MarR family transcriptional regulator [bacterium]